MPERASVELRRRHLLALRVGARRARARRPNAREWIQVNCGLFAQAAADSAYFPWAELADKLQAWRTEKRFDQCFFMRKPPGLRLRFSGADPIATLEPVLIAWMQDAEDRNLIRSFRFATYEPEVFLFGGEVGMAIAHDQFDRDTRLVIRYEALLAAGTIDLTRDRFSLALMQDLLVRFAEDRGELWDIWRRVWHAHGCPPLAPAETVLIPALDSLAGGAASLAREGLANNEAIALSLRAADTARRLQCGPRAWLAQVCTFHWNRLGLSLPQRTRLMSAMLQLLDPHRVDGPTPWSEGERGPAPRERS